MLSVLDQNINIYVTSLRFPASDCAVHTVKSFMRILTLMSTTPTLRLHSAPVPKGLGTSTVQHFSTITGEKLAAGTEMSNI